MAFKKTYENLTEAERRILNKMAEDVIRSQRNPKEMIDEYLRVSFVLEGKKLVKPELTGEWENYVNSNAISNLPVIADVYSVMHLLSEGNIPKDAAEKGIRNSKGSDIDSVVEAVFHFHPSGPDFSNFWNQEHGPKQE